VPVASPDQYLANLNPAQREAVLHTEGALLVIAGAGSGKTRVLTHRVAHLITAVGVKPNEILAITFTNKAAGEMRERLTTMLGPVARAIWILTFHAACGRILRSEAERLGYKSNFTIYDSADQVRLVKQCLEELEKDPKRFVPRGVHAQISNAKNQLVTPALYAERISSFYDQTIAEAYELYQRRLAASNAVDFDDMLMLTVQILEQFPDARQKWQNAFRYVLVDEYQDTNHAQYRFLQLIAEKHQNVCAVGDPDQCLVEGTRVTMADGSTKAIEDVRVGDEVLSCEHDGSFGGARVTRTHESNARIGLEISTRSGRVLVSTPEHVHFSFRPPEPAGGAAVATRVSLDAVARPASAVRPGMVMIDERGEYDLVESVERVVLDRPVYDLDVERTHNFVANGLLTHNSIYAFRGADIRNILEFERDFPATRTIALEQNYRSTNAILEAANAVIDHNSERKPKRLWSELGEGDPVRVVEVEDEQAESRYVSAQIAGLVEEGYSGSEIAVFYRMNAQSRVLEQTLRLHGIGYQVIGGPRFYERAEVKDATAYLQVLDNTDDAVSLMRIANRPKRGIGDTTISRLVAYADAHGISLFDALERPTEAGLGTAAVKAVTGLRNLLDSLRSAAQELEVPELLQEVLERSGTLEAYEAERTIEARGRIENLEAFVDGARQYVQEAEEPSLSGFLQEISLYSDQDALAGDGSNVTLMTIHNAKGLEFRAVFVVGVEEEIFPSSRSIEEQGIEEERRLFYVGLTRAQERLTLTHASSRLLWGRTTAHLPSRFLDELPGHRVERERLRPSSWRSYGTAAQTRDIQPRVDHPALQTGDSVRHGTLGEGVITRIEPGGVVTVRFANDGSERKLMLDYAPLEKL
jgi:DNA helicase II / ATP-dependent DNA helicase PcrA